MDLRVAGKFTLITGIIVFDLMVIPGDYPRERGVRRLQIWVGFIKGVPVSVIAQRAGFARSMMANFSSTPAGFINVVAEKQNKVEILAGEIAVGNIIALLVLLTGG